MNEPSRRCSCLPVPTYRYASTPLAHSPFARTFPPEQRPKRRRRRQTAGRTTTRTLTSTMTLATSGKMERGVCAEMNRSVCAEKKRGVCVKKAEKGPVLSLGFVFFFSGAQISLVSRRSVLENKYDILPPRLLLVSLVLFFVGCHEIFI